MASSSFLLGRSASSLCRVVFFMCLFQISFDGSMPPNYLIFRKKLYSEVRWNFTWKNGKKSPTNWISFCEELVSEEY